MRIKKRRGIFYTPSNLAVTLAAWSVRSPADIVLEPSFGGCGFISALQTRFVSIGNRFPLKSIYGCDVDHTAFKRHFPDSVGGVPDKRHFLKADFLCLTPKDFGGRKFSAVIGNPPYVSYHNMYRTQRFAAATVRSDEWFALSGMASLWAYFVFHALRFLEREGRMAWILPGSLLHSDYSKRLLHELSMRFVSTTVISLNQRVFAKEGVSETTELLLCDDLQTVRKPGQVEIRTAENISACANLLKDWPERRRTINILNGRAVPALAGATKLKVFSKIAASTEVKNMARIATIRIGIVTGANSLFIVNEGVAAAHALPKKALRPIFSKFSITRGLRLTDADFDEARKDAVRCIFVDGRNASAFASVKKYFAAVPKAIRRTNVTFQKYTDWRCPDDDRKPDAFFPYMHHSGPRLVLNDALVNASNTIHRVYFKTNTPDYMKQFLALTLLSTFSQISAELEGRSYGGGVLKHEPSEVQRIQFIAPDKLDRSAVKLLFQKVDLLLRAGLSDQARYAVDAHLLAIMAHPPASPDWLSLRDTLTTLRTRRYRPC